jgi:hypothetical protein
MAWSVNEHDHGMVKASNGRFRHACLRAFVTRDSLELRFALTLWFTLDPADYPAELQPELGQARRIILADQAGYERILHTLKAPIPYTSVSSRAF